MFQENVAESSFPWAQATISAAACGLPHGDLKTP